MTISQNLTLRNAWLAGLVGLSLLVATGWLAQSLAWSSPPATAAVSRPLPVAVRRVAPTQAITPRREYTGTVKARRESTLSFELAGRVHLLLAEEGDRVEHGQRLATLDVAQWESRLQAAQAQLRQAQAVLRERVAGPRTETIAAMQARVAGLTAETKRLQLSLERAKRLVENGAVSREELDQWTYQFESARGQQEAAQRQLDELNAGTRKEQIEAQRATVEQLEAEVRSLELQVADGELTAPFAGRIAKRFLDEGTVVAAGAPLFTLIEDHQLEAWIGLPAEVAGRLQPAQSYPIRVGDQLVRGTLASRRPLLDSRTRTQNVTFALHPAEQQALVPGQIARLRLTERLETDGFLLPTSALAPGPRGLWNVLVVRRQGASSVVEQRVVELMYTLGEEALVEGTLVAGDRVILSGVHRVVPGQVVLPVDSEREAPR